MTQQSTSKAEAILAGTKHYYTGLPCKNGHLADRITNSGHCVLCLKEARNARRKLSPERHRKLQTLYSERNKQKNPERFRELKRQRSRRAREKNPSENYRMVKEWREKNPQKFLDQLHRRRQTNGTHNHEDISRILLQQKGRCGYCRKSLGKKFHRDHIMPIALGGTNDAKNIQLLCPKCNQKKHCKHPVEFAQSMGMLI